MKKKFIGTFAITALVAVFALPVTANYQGSVAVLNDGVIDSIVEGLGFKSKLTDYEPVVVATEVDMESIRVLNELVTTYLDIVVESRRLEGEISRSDGLEQAGNAIFISG